MTQQTNKNVNWDNLTPSQLMAISVQSNVEVNERITATQAQVADVITRVDETTTLLKESLVNQRHIEKEVDETKTTMKDLKDYTIGEFVKVRNEIKLATIDTSVKNSQLRLVKWIGALAVTVTVTWFFTGYLPNRDKTDQLVEIKTAIVEAIDALNTEGDANAPLQQNQP